MDEKIRVLFVDDEENVLKALRRTLHRMSDRWEMSFVTDGYQALQLMESQPFDVIVSDMMMPGMSGEQLLNTVKERYPETARIVLSGQCNQSTAFRLVGSDHFYLSKPCARELFITTVEQAIHILRPQEKMTEAISSEELLSIVAEFSRNLLMRGIIQLSDIPERLRFQYSDDLLDYFAPFIDGEKKLETLGDEYVTEYLDATNGDSLSYNWIFLEDEKEPA